MFDDMKLNMKFLLRLIVTILFIVSLVFTFIQNQYALLYLHTWTLMIDIMLFIPLFIFSARKLFQNKDYEIEWINVSYFCVFILNVLTFILGCFFMEEKIWMVEFYSFSNVLSIIVLPLYIILDFTFLVDKGLYKFYFVPSSFIVPILYSLIILVRALIKRGSGSIKSIDWNYYYPYILFNLDNGEVLFKCLMLVLLIVALAFVAYGTYYSKRKVYEIEKEAD